MSCDVQSLLTAAASFFTALTRLFFAAFSVSTVTLTSSLVRRIFHVLSPTFQVRVLLQ